MSSIVGELKALHLETAAWLVKMSILNHLLGAELAFKTLGDADGAAFRDFVYGLLPIRKATEYRDLGPVNTPSYRGMICMALDDLGFRDPDQRDAILTRLTGVSRDSEWLTRD